MRFPKTGASFFHYADLVGVETQPFPNPLTPAAGSTVIELGGQAHYAETPADLPDFFREVSAAWDDCLEERAHFSAVQEAIRARDLATIKKLWNELVPRFDDVSFSGYLAISKAFSSLPFEYREAFGQVGFGTGGWDTNFPDSILEILRVVYVDADADQRRIIGGAQLLPERLWNHAPSGLAHWPEGTSLASLHGGHPRPGVAVIRRVRGGDGAADTSQGPIAVTDKWGQSRQYPAVIATCQRWLLSARIDVVDRPFWKDVDPATGRQVMNTTLTDRLTRGTYLLDNGPDQPALICLSYTWNDDALKWLPLDADERVRLMLHSLKQIHPAVDIASHIVGDPITVSWEDDPNFMGAFSDRQPSRALQVSGTAVHALHAGRNGRCTPRDLPGRRRRVLDGRLGGRRRHYGPERGLGRHDATRREDLPRQSRTRRLLRRTQAPAPPLTWAAPFRHPTQGGTRMHGRAVATTARPCIRESNFVGLQEADACPQARPARIARDELALP
jgi:tryptophan 2-monooxygenase